MRVAYITDEILNEAYQRNDINWMLMIWDQKGIAGTYPSPEMHTFAFNQYIRSLQDCNNTDKHLRWRAQQSNRNWQNIAKFIDTVITHPEYRLNVVAPHRKIIEELTLKHASVDVQLMEVN